MTPCARRILRSLLCLAVTFWIAAAPAADQTSNGVAELSQEIAQITGLRLKKPIAWTTISRDQLKTYLERQIRTSIKPDEIRAEELTLKKFGLVPRDFDLAKATVELMTEQAAAFYDYHQKKLYLLESTAGSSLEQTALVHELAHALADQHFRLEKFIRGASQTDDGSLARVSVMEGQATWIMTEYSLRKSGLSLVKSPAMAEMMAANGESGSSGSYPVLEGAPLYLRQSLIFPYTQGMRFQQKVVEKLGSPAAFDEVFRKPPLTTQEIIHPDRYLERASRSSKLPRPPLLEVPSAKDYRGLAEGGVGEFDHDVLIEQYGGKDEAAAVAPHWTSGFYRIFEARHDRNRIVLSYAVEWDNPQIAARYFDLYRSKIIPGKSKVVENVEKSRDSVLTGHTDDGWFVLRREGPRVFTLEGLPTAEDARAAAQTAPKDSR